MLVFLLLQFKTAKLTHSISSIMQAQIDLYQHFDDYYFQHPQNHNLSLHQSHLNSETLITIRCLAFGYMTGLYLWTLCQMPSLNTNFIFLTLLGCTSTWLYFGLCFQDYYLFNGKKRCAESRNFHKLIQLIYEIALCIQVPITLVFWTLLFRGLVRNPRIKTQEIIKQANLHIGPLLFLIIDLTHNTFSFPVRHISLLVVVTAIYLLINMIYSLNVRPIYRPIPWTNLASYLIAAGCILLVLLVHYLARWVFREWKFKKLQQKGLIITNNGFNQLHQKQEK